MSKCLRMEILKKVKDVFLERRKADTHGDGDGGVKKIIYYVINFRNVVKCEST